MPVTSGLPVSRLVKIDVTLTTPAIVAPAINTCLLLGTSPVIDPVERVRRYTDINEVGLDFGSTTEEYLGAALWFAQSPSPDSLFIGRWVKTASRGRLIGASLAGSEQVMSKWTTITNGGFNVSIDGVQQQVTGINLAATTNLNGVASAINARLVPVMTPPNGGFVWNAQYDRFELYSGTTGTTSMVTFLTAPTGVGTPTDISAQLKMTVASSGTYVANGQAPEKALTAVVAIDASYSSKWYALVCPSAQDSPNAPPGVTDHQDLGMYCEAADPPHYYGVTTTDTGSLNAPAVTSTDIGYILHQLGLNKTAVQYSTNPYAIMSYLARILTTQWTGSNTSITLMYKQEPGVTSENINSLQADNLQAKCINVITTYSNGANLIEYGTSASGEFTDTIIGADALALDLQNNLFNVLYTSPTKVPQTDSGMQLLLNAATATCAQYSGNGWLGEGVWNAQGFGTLKTGDLLPLGYYIFAPSMLLQSPADRAARKAPLMQIAAKCAGAIHTAEVVVYVNN